jgi:hypothetical protein
MSAHGLWSRSRPRIFVGSSTEAKPVAERLHALLSEFARPRLWPHSFRLSQHFLDDILRQARECEFGVFVLTADDLVTMRGETLGAARDNVLFELGVFFGALGKDRAFFIFCGDDPPSLPSDLQGMTAGVYRGPSASSELLDALNPIAIKIQDAILSVIPVSPLRDREDDVRHVMLSASSAMSRAIPGSRSEDIGVHVWWLDAGDPHEEVRLTRVLRVRPGSSMPNNWAPWRRGEGVVGTAWEQNNTVHLDLADPQVQAVTSAEEFERLPDTLRLGATYEGFEVTRGDFRAVWGTPIHHPRGGFSGVLSLNVDKDITQPWSELNTVVRPAVRDLAATVAVLAPGA